MSNQPYQPYQPYDPYKQPYPSPGQQYLAPPQTSGMATASLIFGLLSYVIFPILGAIVAVICGHAAKSQIRNSNGTITGDGLATAGLILGYIQLILAALGLCGMIIFYAFAFLMAGASSYQY
jgi:hypothetical protein